MKLWEILLPLLRTQAEVLQYFTEVCTLSRVAEELDRSDSGGPLDGLKTLLNQTAKGAGNRMALLAELDALPGKLPIQRELEPFVWSYVPYRAIVESEADLEAKVTGEWIDELTVLGKAWVHQRAKHLGLSTEALRGIEASWVRFRSDCLKKIGVRSLR